MVASTFRFHPAAEVELSAAADWYEGRRPGLGRQFVDAVHAKVADIVTAQSGGGCPPAHAAR